ncbi:MAG: hypothetical protein ACRDYD_00760, partial [Acidimicrobiales bacterium]
PSSPAGAATRPGRSGYAARGPATPAGWTWGDPVAGQRGSDHGGGFSRSADSQGNDRGRHGNDHGRHGNDHGGGNDQGGGSNHSGGNDQGGHGHGHDHGGGNDHGGHGHGHGGPPGNQAPSIGSFTATATVGSGGGRTELSWTSTGASDCTLASSPSVPVLPAGVPCNGTTDVGLLANTSSSPQTYVFTLTAGSPGAAPAHATATTVVQGASSPPQAPSIGSLSAAIAAPGTAARLSWSTSNATTCQISATPNVAGLPRSVPCGSSPQGIALPANPSPLSPLAFTFTLTASGSVARPATATAGAAQPPSGQVGPLSVSTSEVGSGTTLAKGDILKVGFDETVSVASGFSLTLTDGTNEAILDGSDAMAGANGETVTYTITGSPKLGATGQAPALEDLEVLSQSGVANGAGSAWNLQLSGAESQRAGSELGVTRIFGGSNANLDAIAGAPLAPQLYDVIPVATPDLPDAPELVTACPTGASDTVYDAVSGQVLGQDPCGTPPKTPCPMSCPSSYAGLDYIPAPGLTSFEQVVVVQTVPGSLYESAVVLAPQITGISVSGSTATFTYDEPVTCQAPGTASQVHDQFKYYPPANPSDLYTYATGVTCPPPTGGYTITATFPGPIAPGTVSFKYEGYGSGYFVVAGSSSSLDNANAREASQSARVTVP